MFNKQSIQLLAWLLHHIYRHVTGVSVMPVLLADRSKYLNEVN
jgi:hypothetical protein